MTPFHPTLPDDDTLLWLAKVAAPLDEARLEQAGVTAQELQLVKSSQALAAEVVRCHRQLERIKELSRHGDYIPVIRRIFEVTEATLNHGATENTE